MVESENKVSKYCRNCHQWLDSSQFHTEESLICKECQSQRVKNLIS